MCHICCATRVLHSRRSSEQPWATFGWEGRSEEIDVWSEDIEEPEGSPGTFRVRRTGETDWSDPLPTTDLAMSLLALGISEEWPDVPCEVWDWVVGGDFETVREHLLRPKSTPASRLKDFRKQVREVWVKRGDRRITKILALPGFQDRGWLLSAKGDTRTARTREGDLSVTLRIYDATGLIRRTRVTLACTSTPLTVTGEAESVGRVIEAIRIAERVLEKKA